MGKRVNPKEEAYSPVSEALAKKVASFGRSGSDNTAKKTEELPKEKEAIALKVVEEEEKPSDLPRETREKPNKMKTVLLTPTEDADIKYLLAELTASLGVPCKLSHLLRACLAVLHHSEHELKRFGNETGALKSPKNGDLLEMARFENDLARLIVSAIKKAPPMTPR